MKIIHYFLAVAIFSIMVIPATAQTNEVPSWIKNTAKWWAEDQVSDTEFLEAMGFLVREGVINPYRDEQQPTEIQIEKLKQENAELRKQMELMSSEQIIENGWEKASKDVSRDWVNNAISNEEYFAKMQTAIDNYSIVIPPPDVPCGVKSDRLPMWIKDNAKSWVNDNDEAKLMSMLSCLKELEYIK